MSYSRVTKHPKTKINFLSDAALAHIAKKDGIFLPRSNEEVAQLIRYAQEKNACIRTLGSQHSPQAAIYTDEKPLICLMLDGDLRKVVSIEPEENKDFAVVRVGAGCHLGVDPQDASSTLENSFNYQVNEKGYALPMLGGISHQTIAGFLQTSSSGGSAKHGIADVIEEIELINGKGEICKFKKGNDEFNAAVVSMGLFGVITNVTFRLPKNYLVEGKEENKKIEDSFLAKDANGNFSMLTNALFNDNDYIHINWLAQKGVNRTMQWTGQTVETGSPIKPYHHALESKCLSLAAAAVLAMGNKLDQIQNPSLALKIKSCLLKPFADLNEKQHFRDIWYKALPIDDQADVDGIIDTDFSEIWFPKQRLNEVMQALEKLFETDPHAAGNFIVELYCAKQSPFWLSPSYGEDALRVDLYWWKRNIGSADEYFGKFWATLLSIPDARLHWGKVLPITGKKYGDVVFDHQYLESVYPKFDAWLKLREQMDPQQIFVSDYWRKIFNIAPLQATPKYGRLFSVSTSEIAENVDVGWVERFSRNPTSAQ